MESETLPSVCYILSDESSIPFYSTSNGYNYCTLSPESNLFTRLLNREKSLCNKIREYNKKIDVIQEGVIFINGHNIVIDTHLIGSFLITFNSNTTINNISYPNQDHKIIEYITAKQCNNFLVSYVK